MKPGQSEGKRGAFYWVGDKPFISVTEVLKVIDKPALRYWFGKQVYYAMLQNPALNEQEALQAPYNSTDSAKTRGTTVHSIVEAYKHTKEHIATIPADFRGYANAFYKWVEDFNITIVEHEKTVISQKHRYAGTMDLLARINGNEHPIVVDVKTGKNIYPEAFLQTSAYEGALKEGGIDVDGISVLLLQEDGSYKYEFCKNVALKFDGFLSAKKLYEAINEEALQKVGYL